MEITEVHYVTPAHLELLLEADPSKDLVEEYLDRGTLWEATITGKIVGVIAIIPTRPETVEIVNLAVHEDYRGQGIAQELLNYILNEAKRSHYRTVEIGTGSTGMAQLYLYQKCGFRMISIDRDFFVRHYAEPIIENGLVLKDMVRLSQDI